jgi:hypothetical protein
LIALAERVRYLGYAALSKQAFLIRSKIELAKGHLSVPADCPSPDCAMKSFGTTENTQRVCWQGGKLARVHAATVPREETCGGKGMFATSKAGWQTGKLACSRP